VHLRFVGLHPVDDVGESQPQPAIGLQSCLEAAAVGLQEERPSLVEVGDVEEVEVGKSERPTLLALDVAKGSGHKPVVEDVLGAEGVAGGSVVQFARGEGAGVGGL
jgi:hypothetical protein